MGHLSGRRSRFIRLERCTPRGLQITGREYAGALAGGCAAAALAAWLFYDSPAGLIAGIPLLYLYVQQAASDCRRRRKEQDERKFRDGIQAVAVSLSAGASPERAFADGYRELSLLYGADDDMAKSFAGIVRKNRSGIPLETALRDFAAASRSDPVRDFAEVFECAKRLGGSLVAIISGTVRLLSDQQEVKQEIETVLSGRKFEQRIMSGMPFALILYLRLTMPGFLTPLYDSPAGLLVMSGALAVMTAASLLGRKISDIRV